jgi:hypothetical protein
MSNVLKVSLQTTIPATLIWCHLVYLPERREDGQETDSRTRDGPANNFSGGKEALSSESLTD